MVPSPGGVRPSIADEIWRLADLEHPAETVEELSQRATKINLYLQNHQADMMNASNGERAQIAATLRRIQQKLPEQSDIAFVCESEHVTGSDVVDAALAAARGKADQVQQRILRMMQTAQLHALTREVQNCLVSLNWINSQL